MSLLVVEATDDGGSHAAVQAGAAGRSPRSRPFACRVYRIPLPSTLLPVVVAQSSCHDHDRHQLPFATIARQQQQAALDISRDRGFYEAARSSVKPSFLLVVVVVVTVVVVEPVDRFST